MLRHLFIFFFVFNSLFVLAQKNSNDAGLWATLSVSKKINSKFSVIIDQELRLKENYQRLNLFYTNIGISYKPVKFIKIEPTLRTIQKKLLDGNFSYRHRFMLDAIVKKKFNKITLSERLRYQTEVQDYYTSAKGKLFEQFLRFKTDVKYNVSEKITPYYSVELRLQLRAQRGDAAIYNGEFHRVRNVLGFEYEINKKNAVNIYYLIQNEFTISSPEHIYILGIGYSLNL